MEPQWKICKINLMSIIRHVNRDLATDVATQDVLVANEPQNHDFVSMLLMVAVRKTSFVFLQKLMFCSCGTDSCFD